MGSFSNLVLLISALFFFPLSLNLFPVAESNESLINTLCSKTEEPVVCKDCLHSVPKSTSANAQELALMALDCAERDTTHLQNDTFGLLQNATGELKEALDQCSGNSFLAQQEYSPVRGYVQQGDYKSAADVITGDIIPYVASCLQAFDQAPDLPVPPLVLAGTLASNQTAKIAASILTNI